MTYSIGFTVPISTEQAPYGYDALGVGLVLLSFGVGNARRALSEALLTAQMIGSISGGRWSDYTLARLTRLNDGVREPEMRLKSTYWALSLIPLSVAA